MTVQDQITKLTKQLVAIPSVSSNQKECLKAIELVENLFSTKPLCLQRIENQGVYSLVISQQQTLSFELLLLGHLDVVDAPAECFFPEIRNSKLYGRGSADMKGSCAAMIQLFLNHGSSSEFENCGLILTTDEETGGDHGARYLVEQCGLKTQTLFNPDGGNAFIPCLSEKGSVAIQLKTKGKAAHGSIPWTGENAIELLLKDINTLRSEFNKATAENPKDFSFSLGSLRGGETYNSVPDKAFCNIDIRIPEEFRYTDIIKKIESLIFHSQMEIITAYEPVTVDPECRALEIFFEALKEHGFPKETTWECGGSDACWFREQQSDIILIKPVCSEFHIKEEWVDLSSLEKMYEVLLTYVHLISSQ